MGDSPRIVISLSEVPQARPAVQNLPAVQEIRVPALVREDPLEKRMATHSSILAWRIPWTEGIEHTLMTSFFLVTSIKTYFQIRSQSEIWGLGLQLIF